MFKEWNQFLQGLSSLFTSHPHPPSTTLQHTPFPQKSGRVWRTSEKLTALLVILPTVLRGFVPAVRKGLNKVILGLRILQGRCVNGTEAAKMRVHQGDRPIKDEDIAEAESLIIEGLSMLEGTSTISFPLPLSLFTCHYLPAGCTPIDLVPPVVHCFVHYGDGADRFGVLLWYMLACFERFNKKIKNLVGNATHPLASLKAALLRDAGRTITLTLTLKP